jgi:hypothetical protein
MQDDNNLNMILPIGAAIVVFLWIMVLVVF